MCGHKGLLHAQWQRGYWPALPTRVRSFDIVDQAQPLIILQFRLGSKLIHGKELLDHIHDGAEFARQ
jgi:hypothetical protein